MLPKGSKLQSYTYRLDGSDRVFLIRGVSQSKVFRRLFKQFCYDWERNIEIFAYPTGVSVYNGPVGCLKY